MFTLLSSLLVFDTTWSVCPDSSLLMPCSCEDDNITCIAYEDIDLVKIFQTLGKQLPKTGKHFKQFYLSNDFITELKENTFSDITFDEIFIVFCPKLKTIHRNAFNTTNIVTKKVYFSDNELLTSPDNSIFNTLSEFVHAKIIRLRDNNIKDIPSNAFNNTELKSLSLTGSFRKLENNAFSRLKNLEFLTLSFKSIDFIHDNAFEFNKVEDKRLFLYLSDNMFLNYTGFSLTKFRRPVTINIRSYKYYYSNLTYIDQKVFQPFLEQHPENWIMLKNLDCRDCRNNWFKTNKKYFKRVRSVYGLKDICSKSIVLPDQTIDSQANHIGCSGVIDEPVVKPKYLSGKTIWNRQNRRNRWKKRNRYHNLEPPGMVPRLEPV